MRALEGFASRTREKYLVIEKCPSGLEIELAEIRARAMKPSLKKIGRFDEKRVRERLLIGFNNTHCSVLKHYEVLVGFFYIVENESEIHLMHLYVDPAYQNLGFGKQVLDFIKSNAKGKIIKLNALKESTSNVFYKKNGFQFEYEDESDNYYSFKS